VRPDNPTENPAAIVEALDQKIDKEYAGRPDPGQQEREPAEDVDPGASGTEANTVEPPD
jgi:hypothetical protein